MWICLYYHLRKIFDIPVHLQLLISLTLLDPQGEQTKIKSMKDLTLYSYVSDFQAWYVVENLVCHFFLLLYTSKSCLQLPVILDSHLPLSGDVHKFLFPFCKNINATIIPILSIIFVHKNSYIIIWSLNDLTVFHLVSKPCNFTFGLWTK